MKVDEICDRSSSKPKTPLGLECSKSLVQTVEAEKDKIQLISA